MVVRNADISALFGRLADLLEIEVAQAMELPELPTLAAMRFGVDQARRGWLSSGDVLHTRSWPEPKKLLIR